MKFVRIVLLVAGVAVALAVLSWTPRSHAQDAEAGRDLAGSWNVTVTPAPVGSNCAQIPIPISVPPFTELATYSAGGTLIETNAQLNSNTAALIPGAPSVNASDGHGAWEREGGHFAAFFRKLVFDPGGVYVANADIREMINVDSTGSNQFSGTFTIKFSFFSGGNICGEGSLSAQRIRVD